MNYETRERAMKFAIEWAFNETSGGCSAENIISAAEKFEKYLVGTWREPGWCLGGEEETSGELEDFVTVQLPVGSYVTMFDEVVHGGGPLFAKENVKSRGDRIREALEDDGIEIHTITVPGGVCGFTNLGEWLRNMNTTQETAED